MKTLVTLASIIILISCSGVRNDDREAHFGNSQTLATTRDNAVYKVIDTAKIYQLVASYYKYDTKKDKYRRPLQSQEVPEVLP